MYTRRLLLLLSFVSPFLNGSLLLEALISSFPSLTFYFSLLPFVLFVEADKVYGHTGQVILVKPISDTSFSNCIINRDQ